MSSRRASTDMVRSIRRESFIEAFGIKEVEEDAGSSSTEDHLKQSGQRHRHRSSITIDDIEDITCKNENGDSMGDSMGVSLLGSFTNDMDVDKGDRGSQDSHPLIPSRRDSTGGTSFASRGGSAGSSTPHSRRGSAGPTSFASRRDSTGSSTAPNFAGGNQRRKGDKARRLKQRYGVQNSIGDNRRASTGTMGSGAASASVQESFGDMSLASFSSINSFTSSVAGGNQKMLEVGNLVFVTDAEMEMLMYGDEKNNCASGTKNEGGMSTSNDSTGFASKSHSFNFSDDESTTSQLSSSLPPSAVLGTGAFSTVRLAWRKTPEHDMNMLEDGAILHPSESDRNMDEHDRPKSRRSIVRVQSKASGGGKNAPLEGKGELVAVKIIQKSILKQMKTIQKGPNNRMTVRTAFDNIEREIATMKKLKHPNLVRLFEVIDSVESDRLHMVLEYVSLGEILSHVEGTNRYTRMRYRKKVKGLTPDGHFDEKHAALYFVDIMHGLAFLHRNRICHRDLKPENILLCESGIAKISDFGVAHMFEDEQTRESYMCQFLDDDSIDDMLSIGDDMDESEHDKGKMNSSPTHLTKRESDTALNMSARYDQGILKKTEGTWCFWSPEMCSTESTGFSGYAADLWAAGVCLYIFTTGMLPFFSMIPSDLFDQIAKADVRYEDFSLSDELKDLLCKLLTKDPSVRAGVGDCLKHKFCANARMGRIGELGIVENEEHIILSKNDVEMALSVTAPGKHFFRQMVSKRFSAPATAFDPDNEDDPVPTAPTVTNPVRATKNDSKITDLTETSADPQDDVVEDKRPLQPSGSSWKRLRKKGSLASKLKLKNLWQRKKI